MSTLDRFMPRYDIRERFEMTVHAPPAIVLQVAKEFDMQSVRAIRVIFWLREKLLRAKQVPRRALGLAAETQSLGWGVLSETQGREYVSGAYTRPWQPNPEFCSLSAELFAPFSEPDWVKIVWTLEVLPRGAECTRFATETRALATDEAARRKFKKYWRLVRVGVVLIRLLTFPGIRRESERRYRETLHGAELTAM